MQYMLRMELFELPSANLPLLVQLLNPQCILIRYEENTKHHYFEKDIQGHNINLELENEVKSISHFYLPTGIEK